MGQISVEKSASPGSDLSGNQQALAPRGEKGKRLPPAKSLEIHHFAMTYQLRTGAPSFADPFTAPDWRKIAVNRVLGLGAPKPEDDAKVKA